MNEVTRILTAMQGGDGSAAEHLLPLVYTELRRLATNKLAQERPRQTLQATALVHEAYCRPVDGDRVHNWNSRGHFFVAAAEAMRRILIENARLKLSRKHGGGVRRVSLDQVEVCTNDPASDLLDLHEALEKLAGEDPVKARLVELRYFAGLSVQDAADALGISRATADRYWAYAKVWLYDEIAGEAKPAPG
jgi:RNA polymerase sigma factor (TIGR02999 family)